MSFRGLERSGRTRNLLVPDEKQIPQPRKPGFGMTSLKVMTMWRKVQRAKLARPDEGVRAQVKHMVGFIEFTDSDHA